MKAQLKKFTIFPIVTTFILSSALIDNKPCCDDKSAFEKIGLYLKGDSMLRNSFLLNENESIRIFISPDVILPKLSMVDHNVVLNKYKLTEKDIRSGRFENIVSFAQDSLWRAEDSLAQVSFPKRLLSRAHYIKDRKDNFCVYCSRCFDMWLYCDVVHLPEKSKCLPYSSISQQPVAAFLFQFDERNEIINVYKSIYEVD